MINVFRVLIVLALMPDIAFAYVPLAGGGMFFQVIYLFFTALVLFLVVPTKNIRAFIKKKFKR